LLPLLASFFAATACFSLPSRPSSIEFSEGEKGRRLGDPQGSVTCDRGRGLL
jgi:hypothetical protein